MANSYSATKHLYTLNDSKDSEEELSDEESLEDEEARADLEDLQRQNKKLIRKNEEHQKTIAELHLKNQELVELNQLAEVRNVKHEEKQRDLIRRLSYFQVGNKQLNGDIKKLQQEVMDARDCRKVEESKAGEVKLLIRKGQAEKDKFLAFVKNLLEMLKRCDGPEEYQLQKQKIIQFLARNVSNSEVSSKLNCEFDFKFQLSRVDTLRQRIKSLEKQLSDSHDALEKERIDRKKMVAGYNQKIGKLRQLYEGLKERVEMQEEQSRRKIKSILNDKNDMIQNLKSKLKESRSRKNSMEIKKSRETRKSFIGDGEYSHLELNQLNEAIQTLEMQIIKEFQE